MATERGVVVKTYNTLLPEAAMVRILSSAACEGCSSKKLCGSDGASKEVEFKVLNKIGACVGDTVLLGIGNMPLFKATFLVYIFPILSMLFGVFLGGIAALFFDTEIQKTTLLCACFFLIFSFVIIRILARHLSQKPGYQPQIIRIVNHRV